jgi:hypothetical protein
MSEQVTIPPMAPCIAGAELTLMEWGRRRRAGGPPPHPSPFDPDSGSVQGHLFLLANTVIEVVPGNPPQVIQIKGVQGFI